jgi:hypothetical protein
MPWLCVKARSPSGIQAIEMRLVSQTLHCPSKIEDGRPGLSPEVGMPDKAVA